MGLKKSILMLGLAGILIGSSVLGMTGCSKKPGTTEPTTGDVVTEAPDAGVDEYHLDKVTYRTITTGEDWGPAIKWIVLDYGKELDAKSIAKENFKASSIRTFGDVDYETMDVSEPVPHKEERNILDAFLSDAEGNRAETGTCVTLEMEVAPYLEAGSPFLFDIFTYQNDYVDTSYEVSMSSPLMTKDGIPVTMEPTGEKGYVENISLLADNFDTSGKYTYKYDDGNRQIDLTYGSWLPEKSKAESSTPLIIWLHGAGEGGTDPNVAILGNKVVNLATDDVQQYFGDTGAAILAPQTPTMWLDTSGKSNGGASLQNNTGESHYTEALMSLITEFVNNHPEIDKTRLYLGGCSNGGFMTINLLVKYPGTFAAAYPVCEPYANEWLTEEKLSILAEVPMWITSAKDDTIVTLYEGYWDEEAPYYYNVTKDENGKEVPVYEYSNALYDRLIKAGAKDVHYSLFDNVVDTSGKYFAEGGSAYRYDGHWSWIYTLNNECKDTIDGKEVTLFEWLSWQKGKGELPQLPLVKEVLPKVNFYLIRHGETEYNVKHLVQGWVDSALTEDGIAQADKLGNGLKDIPFDKAYTSDSKRAVNTCKAVMKNQDGDTEITESLREIHFGDLEGTESKTLWDDPYHAWVGYDDVGGETYEQVANRVKRVMDLAAADLTEGGNILISTHGLSIISLLDAICPDDPLYLTLEAGLDNCSVTILEWDNGAYTLKALNDTTYLNK